MKIYLMKMLGNFYINELLEDINGKDCFKEIGININDKEIEFIIYALPKYQDLILKIAEKTFEEKYLVIYLILNFKYSVKWKIQFVASKFNHEDIQNFTYHYFIPEVTSNKYIFKYLFDNKNLENLLINNSLWFGNPINFTDITDCKVEIDSEPLKENILNFYYNVHLENQGKNKFKIGLEEFESSFVYPSSKTFNSDLLNHHHRGVFSKLGITCFTEKYDNKLMWDSYADGSKGVCLIFDTTISNKKYFKFSGRKVRYFKNLPRYFFDGTGVMEIGHVVCSKTKDYKYEREVREIQNFQLKNRVERKVQFNPQTLKGIIYGANCSSETKEKIIKLVSNKRYNEIEIIESYIDHRLNIKLKNHKIKLKDKKTTANNLHNT